MNPQLLQLLLALSGMRPPPPNRAPRAGQPQQPGVPNQPFRPGIGQRQDRSGTPDAMAALVQMFQEHFNTGGGRIGNDTTPGGTMRFTGFTHDGNPAGDVRMMRGGGQGYMTPSQAMERNFGPGMTSTARFLGDIRNQEGVRGPGDSFPFGLGGPRYAHGAADAWGEFFGRGWDRNSMDDAFRGAGSNDRVGYQLSV